MTSPLSKRLFDLAFVSAATPICAPILVGALCAVYLESGRPLFFSQDRMGLNGSRFRIWKIRTMRRDQTAPADLLFPGWTQQGDRRVTAVGRILRRFRIDELPQFWNVLRGDMSIVGPRPEPWEVATALATQIDGYLERQGVRPGLTGACQVSPVYADFGTIEKSRRKLAYDLEYVRNWSIALDLTILLKSLPVIVRGGGVA